MIIEISRDKAIEYLVNYLKLLNNRDLERLVNLYINSSYVEYCIKE